MAAFHRGGRTGVHHPVPYPPVESVGHPPDRSGFRGPILPAQIVNHRQLFAHLRRNLLQHLAPETRMRGAPITTVPSPLPTPRMRHPSRARSQIFANFRPRGDDLPPRRREPASRTISSSSSEGGFRLLNQRNRRFGHFPQVAEEYRRRHACPRCRWCRSAGRRQTRWQYFRLPQRAVAPAHPAPDRPSARSPSSSFGILSDRRD